ncbi:MAG: hypothetical protein IH614_17995 [Desulfuromonadales bacterium]|nr:hypothetical protein [Desulfuromonadales bacterium]
MHSATVRLQMTDGHEVYFRAPRSEIHRLVLSRHGRLLQSAPHVIQTEKNIPFAVQLQDIRRIHIM